MPNRTAHALCSLTILAIGIVPERNGSEELMPTQNADFAPVIALHCSGAGAGQWRQLGETLGPAYTLFAPEHYGCERTGPWTGTHAFTLADEAVRTIDLVDRCRGQVHIVGHSYGGGVALHVALARPERIASLALYEPSAFHLLKALGDKGGAALAEILRIARETGEGVIAGDYARAVAAFVEYWGGEGAWAALRPSVQAALIRWVCKAPLDFRALIEEPTQLSAYARLTIPVLIMRGEHAPKPTRMIAETLRKLLPAARLSIISGAGHMGPLTHGVVVNQLITSHIAAAETAICQLGSLSSPITAAANLKSSRSFAGAVL
jgi:pimeloyl-ACP methyl ester carboxylesterase